MTLLAKLPPDLATTCTRSNGVAAATSAGWIGSILVLTGDPPANRFNMAPPIPSASVACQPANGAERVNFLWYQFINDRRAFSNATDYVGMFAQRWKVADGDCSSSQKAREQWSNEIGSSGVLICLSTAPFDGAPWITWSFDDDHVLAFASRSNRDFGALYRWFQDLKQFLP